jgi:Zn-finger nucleic acid-binding protein
MDQCPRCVSGKLVPGGLGEMEAGRLALFEPKGLRTWDLRLKPGVRTQIPIRACLECGLVWTELSAQELRDFLRKHGSEETQQLLSEPD